VTSIERTAYPRFKRFLSARELHVFYTPQQEEIAWARGQVRSDEHLLALMVQAKCFGRLGYFPRLEDVPDVVVGHIRRDLGVSADGHEQGRADVLVAEVVSRECRSWWRVLPLLACLNSCSAIS
jgi:hypothetical protein